MQDFSVLGKPMNQPTKELDTFSTPSNVTEVRFVTDELTSFCPVTAQPDFNTVEIIYRPDKMCVESKSLKLYLWTFREEHIFGEALAGVIAQDIFDALDPHYCTVVLAQNIRGGLQMTATATVKRNEHDK